MPKLYEIRADYNDSSIMVYQAYSHAIADAALRQGTFVEPFSFHRMTWIKPSFLWLMHRSNFATKSGQERILTIRIKRASWEKALSLAVSTDPEVAKRMSPGTKAATALEEALVHVQWDPERSLSGSALSYYSIQIGISRFLIREFVNEWITEIIDYTDKTRKIRKLLDEGRTDKAKALLPKEAIYPVSSLVQNRLGMISHGTG